MVGLKEFYKIVKINQACNGEYELLINDVSVWVHAPKSIYQIKDVLKELGLEVNNLTNEEINELYYMNEELFDRYYIYEYVGWDYIIKKLTDKIKELEG